MDTGTSVKVAVRIRPLSSEEAQDDETLCINTIPGEPQIIAGTDAFFTFDNVFGVDSSQSQIYDECVSDLVNAAFEGFNATILAYGQTGSGKTWTMGSASSSEMRLGGDNFGIIPRVITNLFEIMETKEQDDPNSTYKVQVQFLEIYGENIRDLLDPTRTSKVTIRETSSGEVFVSGAREEFVSSASQMMKTLEDGTKHRTTASTLMNLSSSRSHAIFTVFLEHTIHTSAVVNIGIAGEGDDTGEMLGMKTDDDSETPQERNDQKITHSKEVRRCKFHFVDLAGSERAKRTGAQGQQLKEGIDINKGLLALGNVISALGDEQRRGKVHVPYRVSKLTRMLQDSLGGNSKTLMICCVSPSGINFYESLNALRYANRARNIKNKPIVNRDPTLVMIDELKKLVQVLASELVTVRRESITSLPEGTLSLYELELLLLNGNVQRSRLMLGNGEMSPIQPRQKLRSITPFDPHGRSNSYSSSMISTNGTLSSTLSISNTSHNNSNNMGSNSGVSTSHVVLTANRRDSSKEMSKLKSRALESDFEVKRLSEQMKRSKLLTAELSERVILIQSERDFYRMKWGDVCPADAIAFDPEAFPLFQEGGEERGEKGERSEKSGVSGVSDKSEKGKVTRIVAGYLRQIEELRKTVAEQQQLINGRDEALLEFDPREADLESELTSNVARVIAQTEKQLSLEAKRLKSMGMNISQMKEKENVDSGNDSEDSRELLVISGNTSPISERKHTESQIEEDDLAYQRRQKMMIAEVTELGESIELKEQLLGQLRRSHYQYGVMKTFYEQKLNALEQEMDLKQEERDRLISELTDLENSANKNEVEAVKSKKEQESRLRVLLHKKDDELKLLKKRQEELSSLSKVQSRYTAQVSKLESDIDAMRRQKVDLSKSLATEKKKHYTLLNEKAREIEKLKRDLIKYAGEAKKLGKEKIRAEERTNQALRDTAIMRKKVCDAQRYGSTSESAAAKARLARRAMGGAGKTSAQRILTENELRTKRWLDRRIADINTREEAADTLRKQCEQQLALLNRKEALELEKTSMEKSMRDVITGGIEEKGERALSKEEVEALQEIDDRLESVEGQLKLRDRNIFEIERKLAGGDITSAQESTIEALKRTSAVSLPASHELIRLLFDMLVSTKSTSHQRKSSLFRCEAREKQLRHDLDDASARMTALVRAHDMELTRSANENEVKLLGLFTHSTIGKLVIAESGVESESPSKNPPESPQSPASSLGRYRSSAEASYKMLLSVATEQSNLLRSRLERESGRTIEFQSRLAEVDHTCVNLHRDLEEKDVHIKFLEDERALFRGLADSLRAGISTLGGEAGNTILKQIKDRVAGAVPSDDSDDETESVMDEYSNLGDIINRTGNVMEKSPHYASERSRYDSSTPTPSTSASSSSSSSRTVVYDRLTNPSNFTGAMKNAFGHDLAQKRHQVQLIKNGMMPIKKQGIPEFQFLNPRKNHDKNNEHITAYLEGTNGSTEWNPINSTASEGNLSARGVHSKISPSLVTNRDAPFSRSLSQRLSVPVRTTTPPPARTVGLGGSQRIRSTTRSGIPAIPTPDEPINREGRRRSNSEGFADLPRPPMLEVTSEYEPPHRFVPGVDFDTKLTDQTKASKELEKEVSPTAHITTPRRSANVTGMIRKLWRRDKRDGIDGGEGEDNGDGMEGGEGDIERRESMESAYSEILIDISAGPSAANSPRLPVTGKASVPALVSIPKYSVDHNLESRMDRGESQGDEEGKGEEEGEEGEGRERTDTHASGTSLGFEDDDTSEVSSSHYSVTSLGVTSIGSNSVNPPPPLMTREEKHLLKIKSRLQSATAILPVTPRGSVIVAKVATTAARKK